MKQKIYEDLSKRIEIFREINGKDEQLVYFKNGFLYSIAYPNEPYKLSFSLCPATFSLLSADGQMNILMLGTAGGCMAMQLHNMKPFMAIDLVDIDSEAETVAKKYFKCNCANMHFYCEDAAEFVMRRQKKYDYIVIDIFIDDKIPGFVTSKEFWKNIYSILNENGIVAFNNNMRELHIFEMPDNPLVLLLKSIYTIGFQSIFHSDAHNGGWSYLFKSITDIDKIRRRFYDLYRQKRDKYINMAVTVNSVFLREIKRQEDIVWADYDDIINAYRKFVFRGVLRIVRNKKKEDVYDFTDKMNDLTREEIRVKLGKYQDISYTSGKNMFRSNHIDYFKDMDLLSEEMERRRLSSFIFDILMPEEAIVNELQGDSYYMQILSTFGKYSFDCIEENDSLLERVWLKEFEK